MNEALNTALMLMGVGMTTVFVVLFLVVLVGNGLTVFVNRYIPETVPIDVKKASQTIKPGKLAAISAAVEIFTEGKGVITRIDKID